MIGLFLALLELIRQHRVTVRQDKPFGEIWLHMLEKKSLDIRATDEEAMRGVIESSETDQSQEGAGQDSPDEDTRENGGAGAGDGAAEMGNGAETADVLCADATADAAVETIENNDDGGSKDETE